MGFVLDLEGWIDDVEAHFEIVDVLTFFGLLLDENHLDIDLNIFPEVLA